MELLILKCLKFALNKLLEQFVSFRYKFLKRGVKYVQIGVPIDVRPDLVKIENFTRIQPRVKIISAKTPVTIKKYTAIGAGCLIIPSSHTPTVGVPQFLSPLQINDVGSGIVINEDCWIGAESALLSKCEIGRGCVVGARSLVTNKIPPYAVVAGSPAKIIATKFTLEQVLEHERILYPPEERLSEEYLRDLFDTTYRGLKSIGTSEISDTDMIKLNETKSKYKMEEYD